MHACARMLIGSMFLGNPNFARFFLSFESGIVVIRSDGLISELSGSRTLDCNRASGCKWLEFCQPEFDKISKHGSDKLQNLIQQTVPSSRVENE